MTQTALIAPTASDVLAAAGRRERRAPRPPHPYADRHSKHDRGVRAIWCRDCRAPILAGDDNDRCAFKVRVDVTPLTPLGEMLAQLAGRPTYELRHGFQRPALLVRRTPWLISTRPAGAPPSTASAYDVLAAHDCTPTPDAITTPSRLRSLASHDQLDRNALPPF